MKLIAFLLLISMSSNGQHKIKPRNYAIVGTLSILSGVADGLRDATIFHNDKVLTKLNTNSSFWRSDSYLNKYKNRDPKQGERFPGSKSIFVFTTDAPHLLKFSNNLFTAGAVAIKLGECKKRWYVYVLEGIGYWVVNRIGFTITYNFF
jgi:hypothetical protein